MQGHTKFLIGDLIEDDDGDIGFVIVPVADDHRQIVWKCTERVSKQARVGEYYVSHESDVKHHRRVDAQQMLDKIIASYEEFARGEINGVEFYARLVRWNNEMK